MAIPEEQVVDSGLLTGDEVLERELRDSLGKSEGEIELFKTVRKALAIRAEVANSETIATILSVMWTDVAEFFEQVTTAETLIGLSPDDQLVIKHQSMQANFNVVAKINAAIKDGREAEQELQAVDQMDYETEGNEI